MDENSAILARLTSLVRVANSQARLSAALASVQSAIKAGYNPFQPRQPGGRPHGGQWVASHGADLNKILAAASRIKGAYSERYSRCVDLCYSLLERPQMPASDFNLWDYHKCLKTCLNR